MRIHASTPLDYYISASFVGPPELQRTDVQRHWITEMKDGYHLLLLQETLANISYYKYYSILFIHLANFLLLDAHDAMNSFSVSWISCV